jgi:hypothetical protein
MHWFSTTPKTKESKGHWMPDKHKRKQYRPMWVNQNKDKLIISVPAWIRLGNYCTWTGWTFQYD